MQMHKKTTQQKNRNKMANIKLPDISWSELHKISGRVALTISEKLSFQFIADTKTRVLTKGSTGHADDKYNSKNEQQYWIY